MTELVERKCVNVFLLFRVKKRIINQRVRDVYELKGSKLCEAGGS
jgi:hypothetical protein